ncbi:VirB3 family type IV secretion system protein [Burkholderia cepacia]|jgi:type IV secretion system protein VirB3|uniref:VirB3 family type IV secretion system protein n=1 Tax=Burkholderia contaminans TaxID=488447 RepID=A0ABD7YGZ5_9BURK|nr:MULTISPECIES: VirB3 family type IV secretion system protein [Burkholderia]EKS9798984.1 VirB3 family type IV secretion system protein [Burkholderia cepacia]EKS9805938.1 VirB3 family type IV secretion system protein [Burkholderia cepacia]EKS9813486.1 VirB3 family type IV secretion system protein [Burkholderia cepacia]EKS9820325.1 VirB3 family type IV secretion system protein [Burkholderia cepacia]EKS9828190.1 VirB3 family type IV secretion system protein [Burkholderia cepacia]
MEERTLYPSYAALNRTAMIWGIPLIPGLVVFCASLMVGLIALLTLGPGGALLVIPGAAVLMFFKKVSETDDQALRILGFELRCVFARANANLFGRTYTLAPMRYGRTYKNVRRMLERTASAEMSEQFIARFRAELAQRRLEEQHEIVA